MNKKRETSGIARKRKEFKVSLQGQILQKEWIAKNTKLIFFNLNFPDQNEVTREELELDSLRNIHTKPNSQLRNGAFVFFLHLSVYLFKTPEELQYFCRFLCKAWQWQLLLKIDTRSNWISKELDEFKKKLEMSGGLSRFCIAANVAHWKRFDKEEGKAKSTTRKEKKS